MLTPPRRLTRALLCALGTCTIALSVLLGLTWLHVKRLGATVEGLQRDLVRLKGAVDPASLDPSSPPSPLLLQYQLMARTTQDKMLR